MNTQLISNQTRQKSKLSSMGSPLLPPKPNPLHLVSVTRCHIFTITAGPLASNPLCLASLKTSVAGIKVDQDVTRLMKFSHTDMRLVP